MLGEIELFDRDNDRLIKRFANDQLELAVKFAVENNRVSGCVFQQWDDINEGGSLMFFSVDEIKESFDEGECFGDLSAF